MTVYVTFVIGLIIMTVISVVLDLLSIYSVFIYIFGFLVGIIAIEMESA
jgi:hypothetical protein